MDQLISTTPCTDDDVDGCDSPPVLEDWNDECDEGAAFIEHRRVWAKVMTELAHIRPLVQVNKGRRPSTLLDRRGRSLPRLAVHASSCRRCLLAIPLDASFCRRCLPSQFN